MNYFIFLVEERYVKSKFPKPPRFPQYPAVLGQKFYIYFLIRWITMNRIHRKVKEERVKLIHVDGWGRGLIFERGEMEMREVG